MRDIHQYFNFIESVLRVGGATVDEIDFVPWGPTDGVIDGALYFYDGGRLEFTEEVTIEQAKPIKLNYRYQYIRGAEEMFRYDNAPHHPKLPNFPHHKHVAGRVFAAFEPNLSQVLEEITRLMEAQPAEPPAKVKRRRSSKMPRRSK